MSEEQRPGRPDGAGRVPASTRVPTSIPTPAQTPAQTLTQTLTQTPTQARHSAPTPAQVLGPAVAAVLAMLLLALAVQPGAFLVRVGTTGDPAPQAAGTPPAEPAAGGQAAPGRADPSPGPEQDQGAEALAALVDLLDGRDAAVASGDGAAWTSASGDPTDTAAPDGSFVVLRSLPVSRFESSVVPDTLRLVDDPVAAGAWQARVETTYQLADAVAVVRADTVRLAAPADGQGWRPLSWAPHPEVGDVGTVAPWDLGEVSATVGERGVVLSWVDPGAPGDGGTPSQRLQDAQARAAQVGTWVERGAVVVDSYLGTGWPRRTLVLAPATTEQYDAVVPGPAPERPDVFAAVTTDVTTPDGGGDLVVLNPSARDELVDETWQVTVTHELVHVASGARYGDGQEVWLAEGLADLVGWSTVVPSTLDREEVAGRLLERVAAGTADVTELPPGSAFSDADVDVVGDAYEGSWLAALLLQDELGVDGLLDLYADASDGPGSARQRTDGALRQATGEGRAAFTQRWSAYVTDLAAR